MSNIALRMDHVFKKFTKGERHDTLRDLIPALARRAARKVSGNGELRPQEFWALEDVSYEIHKGEAVGIIGHNGAGKSTMLKHLSGLMSPTKGEMLVNGRLSALIEVSAGFHQDLTGRENVFLNGTILGMSRAEILRKFDDIVSFAGLEEFIDTPVKRYSSGMFARLGFSVAAHLEPDILIIDEVLSVGDPAFQNKGVQRMKEIARSGATVIFVSHNLRAVADLCPRSILMDRGRVLADGPTEEVIVRYMDQANATNADPGRSVTIESVSIRSPSGARIDFVAGDHAEVEIVISGVQKTDKISVGMHLLDEKHQLAFDTASERLGLPAINLLPGERYSCRFQLDLHLAPGTYALGISLYRFDFGIEYDRREYAGTILVNGDPAVRGAANLYPQCAVSKLA